MVLVEQAVNGDGFVAGGAGAAEAVPGSGAVAIRASVFREQALLTVLAVADGDVPACRAGRCGRCRAVRRRVVLGAPGGLPASR